MKLFLIVISTIIAIGTYHQEVFAVGACGANQTCVVENVVNTAIKQSLSSVATNGTKSPALESALKNVGTELGRDSTTTTVIVTEEIPGAKCTCIDQSDTTCKTLETRKYKCEVVK